MEKNKFTEDWISRLRDKAEKELRAKSQAIEKMPDKDIRKLVHELQVHQIELEMQNEELRVAQVALEESRNKYSDLYDFAPIGYLSLDKNGIILECNLTFAGQIGQDRRFLSKAPFLRFIHKEDRPGFYEHLQRVHEKKESQTCEIRLKRGDGTEFHARLDSMAAEDAGKSASFRTSVTDISRQKQRENEEEYRNIIDTAREGFNRINLWHEIVEVNAAFCEMLGCRREDLIGKKISALAHEDGLHIVEEQLSKIHSTPHRTYETVLKSRNGSRVHVIINATTLTDASGQAAGSFAFITNITAYKKMEEELYKAQRLESLGHFAGGIAHDFNNLLTGFAGKIAMVRHSLDDKKTAMKKLEEAEKILSAAKQLSGRLFTFSKGGEMLKEKTSLKDLIREHVDFVLSGSNVTTCFSISPDLWRAEVDKGQISQVLTNVAVNARDAMPQGGKILVTAENTLLVEGKVPGLPSGRYVKIVFKDEGAGISQKDLPRIFDPFFSGHKKGSGLGLAVAHSIIHKHGGSIGVESLPGAGASFSLYLPALGEEDVFTREEAHREKKEPCLKGKKILAMDDDADILHFIALSLEEGNAVTGAKDGEAALKAYKKALEQGAPFDVVIMDLTIRGGMGGKEAIWKLKEMDPEARVVVSSGYCDDRILADFSAYGFCAMLPKPYEEQDLHRVLGEVLRKHGKNTDHR